MSVTWRKVWRDLARNKVRTLLAVLSIAAGVFALGLVFGARGVMYARVEQDKAVTCPAHITFRGEMLDWETIDAVRRDASVADVEGEAAIPFRWRMEGEMDWRQGMLIARTDYDMQRVSRTELLGGHWPVERALAVERLSSAYFDIPVGATILVEFGQGERHLAVEGIVRKPYVLPPQFDGPATFFATLETVTSLTGFDGFNKLYVRLVESSQDEMDKARERITDRLEHMGLSVSGSTATGIEDEFDVQELPAMLDAMFLILAVLGVLSLGLSAFLIVNTMSAIVVQQIWQIGVMKVFGATFGRVVCLYLATASIYGGLALLLAMPLGAVCAHLMADRLLEIFSVIGTEAFRVSPVAVAIQAIVGLAVPLLAAVIPVVGGARISPRQAIGTYGLGGTFGRGPLDRLVGRIRRLPRPVALSLRNTFRRKGRVALTLLTFTLAGVMFVTVVSVRVSLDSTVEAMLKSLAYDVMVVFARPYRAAHLVEATRVVPGVARVEVWDLQQAQMSLITGEKKDVSIYGMPPDSQVFRLRIISGRGLLPSDSYAMLLSSGIAAAEGIQVGDEVVLTVAGEETTWTVVGLTMGLGYVSDIQVPFDTLVREVSHVHRGGMVMVIGEAHDAEFQERLIDGLSDMYTARHIEAKSFMSAHQFRERGQELFDFLSYLLLTMALLAAVVGGIGLTGTLSINVVERRREIGVMRAIGAPSSAIFGMFIGEGVFLGLLSWLLAVPLSVPGARLFSDAVGSVIFETTLDFSYSLAGVVAWLAIVLVLSTLSSLWPALQATRVSVREALAYE